MSADADRANAPAEFSLKDTFCSQVAEAISWGTTMPRFESLGQMDTGS